MRRKAAEWTDREPDNPGGPPTLEDILGDDLAQLAEIAAPRETPWTIAELAEELCGHDLVTDGDHLDRFRAEIVLQLTSDVDWQRLNELPRWKELGAHITRDRLYRLVDVLMDMTPADVHRAAAAIASRQSERDYHASERYGLDRLDQAEDAQQRALAELDRAAELDDATSDSQ